MNIQTKIVKEPDSDLSALPGKAMSKEELKKWIAHAEDSPTVSIAEAKQRWATQKRKLRKIIP